MARTVDEMLASLPPHMFRGNGLYEPKLTFPERCGILALYQSGLSVELLAAAFKVNRRTVRHIINPEGKKYRDVRAEVLRHGEHEFRSIYITEALTQRIAEAAGKSETKLNFKEYDAAHADRAPKANPRATIHEGITLYQGPWPFAHRIEIKWLAENEAPNAEHPAGWFARDLDDDPEFWTGDAEVHSHFTSAKALEWFKKENPE